MKAVATTAKKDASSTTSSSKAAITPEHAKDLYYDMVLGRDFEEMCAQMYYRGKMFGFVHLYSGQEAVSTGRLSVVPEAVKIRGVAREIRFPSVLLVPIGRASSCAGIWYLLVTRLLLTPMCTIACVLQVLSRPACALMTMCAPPIVITCMLCQRVCPLVR